MGWRKLTIQDGDLARCSELQRPRRYAELRPWGSFNAAASQRVSSERTEAAGPWRARGRAVTAVCLCSDIRGLGIRMALSQLPEMASWPMRSQTRPPGLCVSIVLLP
jgi:hypothetical protein